MSMMAIFACTECSTESIRGYHRGADAPAPLPEYACVKCLKKTKHAFTRYAHVDERSHAQQTRDRLRGSDEQHHPTA